MSRKKQGSLFRSLTSMFNYIGHSVGKFPAANCGYLTHSSCHSQRRVRDQLVEKVGSCKRGDIPEVCLIAPNIHDKKYVVPQIADQETGPLPEDFLNQTGYEKGAIEQPSPTSSVVTQLPGQCGIGWPENVWENLIFQI